MDTGLVAAVLAASLLLHKAYVDVPPHTQHSQPQHDRAGPLTAAAAALGLGCPGPGVRAAPHAVSSIPVSPALGDYINTRHLLSK